MYLHLRVGAVGVDPGVDVALTTGGLFARAALAPAPDHLARHGMIEEDGSLSIILTVT